MLLLTGPQQRGANPVADGDDLKGRLLVASPSLLDPNFHRTVVLVLEHGLDHGALGVVLNRPSEIGMADPLPAWASVAADPAVVFVGGPVEPEVVIGLGRTLHGAGAWQPVTDELGLLDLRADPDALAGSILAMRAFAGYAGWAPGQLESEIASGGWFVVPADPDDAFATNSDELWQHVLRRQGGVFATFPPDPTQN